MNKNVAFIGYRTSGKTTVSRALAKRTGWPRIEFDRLLEQHMGMSIPIVIQRLGWDAFRCYESRLIDRHLDRERTILDLGGGAVLAEATMRRLGRRALVVFLDCPEQTVIARMREDRRRRIGRPPLTGLDLEQEIHEILALRLPLYRRYADLTIDTSVSAPDRCVSTIINTLSLFTEKEAS